MITIKPYKGPAPRAKVVGGLVPVADFRLPVPSDEWVRAIDPTPFATYMENVTLAGAVDIRAALYSPATQIIDVLSRNDADVIRAALAPNTSIGVTLKLITEPGLVRSHPIVRLDASVLGTRLDAAVNAANPFMNYDLGGLNCDDIRPYVYADAFLRAAENGAFDYGAHDTKEAVGDPKRSPFRGPLTAVLKLHWLGIAMQLGTLAAPLYIEAQRILSLENLDLFLSKPVLEEFKTRVAWLGQRRIHPFLAWLARGAYPTTANTLSGNVPVHCVPEGHPMYPFLAAEPYREAIANSQYCPAVLCDPYSTIAAVLDRVNELYRYSIHDEDLQVGDSAGLVALNTIQGVPRDFVTRPVWISDGIFWTWTGDLPSAMLARRAYLTSPAILGQDPEPVAMGPDRTLGSYGLEPVDPAYETALRVEVRERTTLLDHAPAMGLTAPRYWRTYSSCRGRAGMIAFNLAQLAYYFNQSVDQLRARIIANPGDWSHIATVSASTGEPELIGPVYSNSALRENRRDVAVPYSGDDRILLHQGRTLWSQAADVTRYEVDLAEDDAVVDASSQFEAYRAYVITSALATKEVLRTGGEGA